MTTKLFMPPPRPRAVPRPRLIERLNEGLEAARSLILVSAPAGFGKTTLISAWLTGAPRAFAWLSLDEDDRDPCRFLLYLAAALQNLEPGCCADAMLALQSPRPPPAESILADLINELDGMAKDFLLVLDDYHVVDSSEVDAALAFLVEHLPARMHLLISTREDPDLPLSRLRARGELAELRAEDLRFTAHETADFLNGVMGLGLEGEDVAALESRTEGWIAGLHLAALSMRGQKDLAGFIRSFAGSHRFVLDYLVEEVLRRESEGIQAFLLRSSILDRLCGPLCDALMRGVPGANPGRDGAGQDTLEYLERANLFTVPLDNERRWYRYHRLFAELLRQRLGASFLAGKAAAEESVAELHIRASQWCEDTGLQLEAFRYAARAQDLDRAERLATGKGMPIHTRGAVIAILDWLQSLPAAVLDARPSLRVLSATISLVAGRTGGVEEALKGAERVLQGAEPDEKRRDLIGRIAAARATLAVTRYEPKAVMAEARRALEYLHPEDWPFRMTALWVTAMAHSMQGDRAAVRRAYGELEAASHLAGDVFFTQLALCGQAETQEWDNRLHEAAESYRRALELFGEQPQPNASEAHLGLARVMYEWNDLDAAEEEGERSLRLARQYDSTVDRFILGELLLARIKLARGSIAAAAARLDELESMTRARNFLHRLPEIAALRARVSLARGDVDEAGRQAGASGLPLSRARVMVARNESASALALLEPLRLGMEARDWQDEGLKVLTLQALALRANAREEEALGVLGEAMERAERGGFVRLFLDEGEPMAALLSAAAARGMKPGYPGALLAAFAAERERGAEERSASAVSLSQALVEPLSARELEVLRLVSEGLSNQEIGERLFLALDTIKGHNRRIFDKLEVKRRTEAIARARELGLI